MINAKIAIRILEYFFAFSVIATFYVHAIAGQPFHMDESQYIATSKCFEDLLMGRYTLDKWEGKEQFFEGDYFARNEPPLPRYIIGIGRFGCNRELCLPWRYNLSELENIKLGTMPNDRLLWWARFPMAILAAISATLCFCALRVISGRVAGYIFLVLFCTSHFFPSVLCTAVSESALLFFIMLTGFATYLALSILERHWQDPQKSKRWKALLCFAVAGLFSGLAGSSKLNGMTCAVAVCGAALLSFRHLGSQATISKLKQLSICLSLVATSTIVTFIACNPYLYSNTIAHTKEMIVTRMEELKGTMKDPQAVAHLPLLQRISIIADCVSQRRYSSNAFPGDTILWFSLAAVGALKVAMQALYNRQHSVVIAATTFTAFALVLGIPPLFTPVSWIRYFLLPAFVLSMLDAIGVACLLEILITQLKKRQRKPV